MDREVAKCAADRGEGVKPLSLTIGAAEPQVGLVPATQENVTLLEVVRDFLGLTEQVRKGRSITRMDTMISELLQNSRATYLSARHQPAARNRRTAARRSPNPTAMASSSSGKRWP